MTIGKVDPQRTIATLASAIMKPYHIDYTADKSQVLLAEWVGTPRPIKLTSWDSFEDAIVHDKYRRRTGDRTPEGRSHPH